MGDNDSGSAATGIAALCVALVLGSAVLVGVLAGSGSTDDCASAPTGTYGMGITTGSGSATVAGLNPAQARIAANGVAIGKQRGEPDSVILAQSMAMATESSYRNLANSTVPASLNYPHDAVGSDHDSVGPHQIRVSVHGGGNLALLMDPVWQINWFYDTAATVTGHTTMDPAVLAQAVERSGPDAYAAARERATAVVAAVSGTLSKLTTTTGSTGTGATGESPGTACGSDTGGDPNSPLTGGFGQRVIAAAMRWIGTPYAWGGGNTSGPTRGISDGGGAADANGDTAKTGFDCSGLTLYAVYQASGGKITLGHFTGNQATDPRGQQIPLDAKQPGDLIYFGSSAGGSHHVGIYYGKQNGQDMLLNAPESGKTVAIMPLSGWSGESMFVRRFGGTAAATSPATTND